MRLLRFVHSIIVWLDFRFVKAKVGKKQKGMASFVEICNFAVENKQKQFATMTAKEKDIAEAKRQEKELLALLLEKTGVKKQDLIDMIYREFIKDNLSLVTPAERKRFTKLVF